MRTKIMSVSLDEPRQYKEATQFDWIERTWKKRFVLPVLLLKTVNLKMRVDNLAIQLSAWLEFVWKKRAVIKRRNNNIRLGSQHRHDSIARLDNRSNKLDNKSINCIIKEFTKSDEKEIFALEISNIRHLNQLNRINESAVR